MQEVKSFLKSKTIWGVVLMVLGSVFGYNVPEGLDKEVADIAATLVNAFGAILAVYGRFKADKKIAVKSK